MYDFHVKTEKFSEQTEHFWTQTAQKNSNLNVYQLKLHTTNMDQNGFPKKNYYDFPLKIYLIPQNG